MRQEKITETDKDKTSFKETARGDRKPGREKSRKETGNLLGKQQRGGKKPVRKTAEKRQ